ncbi:MAG TPA: hypothetical protein VMZ31_01510 [Phycisphaerae bacterium]|nr:hypothetical protein [Phycisphaerae bacterium]
MIRRITGKWLVPALAVGMLALGQYGGCTIDDGAFGYFTPFSQGGLFSQPTSYGGTYVIEEVYEEEYYEEYEEVSYGWDWLWESW